MKFKLKKKVYKWVNVNNINDATHLYAFKSKNFINGEKRQFITSGKTYLIKKVGNKVLYIDSDIKTNHALLLKDIDRTFINVIIK